MNFLVRCLYVGIVLSNNNFFASEMSSYHHSLEMGYIKDSSSNPTSTTPNSSPLVHQLQKYSNDNRENTNTERYAAAVCCVCFLVIIGGIIYIIRS